jgi:hypothetical protein
MEPGLFSHNICSHKFSIITRTMMSWTTPIPTQKMYNKLFYLKAICSICLFSIAPTTNLNQSETFFKLEEGYVMLKFGKFKDKLRTCCLRLSKKNNKPLMVTPCNHIFHTPCLKAWYEQKQECPICRLALPLMDD